MLTGLVPAPVYEHIYEQVFESQIFVAVGAELSLLQTQAQEVESQVGVEFGQELGF